MRLPMLCVLTLVGLHSIAKAQSVQIPFEKVRLANGLELILSEEHRIPVVHVQIWYHVGSKEEKPGKTGFAHLFEHMMFQGSRHIAEDTWFKLLDAVGGYFINGTTNNDRTNYFESVPSSDLELVLWMESDRMGFLLDRLTPASFETQREVVRNERRQSYEMRPYGLMEKVIIESLYPPNHPYHHMVIGEHEDLVRAEVADVAAFFREYYAPRNATVAIVGDFEPRTAKALVNKYFGDLTNGPPVEHPSTPPVRAPQVKERPMEANVQLARVTYEYLGTAPWDPDEAPLDLLAMILGDGKSSRLYKRLVYTMRAAQEVSASHDSRQLQGDFALDVMIRPGQKMEAIRKVLDEELARAAAAPVSAEELARVKIKFRARLTRASEVLHGRAGRLQAANHYKADPRLASLEVERYQAVTVEDVQRVAQKYLAPSLRVAVTVVPNPKAPLAGQVITAPQGTP